jgi:sortase A
VESKAASAPSFAKALDISDYIAAVHRAHIRTCVYRVVAVLFTLITVGLIMVPLILQQISSHRLAAESAYSEQVAAQWPDARQQESLDAAYAYNARLAQSGQPVIGEAPDPFTALREEPDASGQEDSAAAQDGEYQSLLNTGDGVMGSVVIPKISVDLPLRHGTDKQALDTGAGHLYGTSLPVGGESTHSVITGHRGLVSALMFTRLDELRTGDVFYITVLGGTFGYQVDRISVIKPEDTDSLRIVPGEDRVTLMTCTPYGVNTHRLLVSALRAPIPEAIPEVDNAPGDPRPAVFIATASVLLIGSMPAYWYSRRYRHLVARHRADIARL